MNSGIAMELLQLISPLTATAMRGSKSGLLNEFSGQCRNVHRPLSVGLHLGSRARQPTCTACFNFVPNIPHRSSVTLHTSNKTQPSVATFRSCTSQPRRLSISHCRISSSSSRDQPAETNLSSNVVVILVCPQGPQNVGAVARAMHNFGITDLRLVSPGAFVMQEELNQSDASHVDPSELLSPVCWEFAVGGSEILRNASHHSSVESAVHDCNVVLGTTARRRNRLPMLSARTAAADTWQHVLEEKRVALLFGNERTGLTNDELRWCTACVAIPTESAVGTSTPSSLNLSHAVTIVCYEMYAAYCKARGGGEGGLHTKKSKDAIIDMEGVSKLQGDLLAARQLLDVLPSLSSRGDSADAQQDEAARYSESLRRMLTAHPLTARDADVLFQIAKRIMALGKAQSELGERVPLEGEPEAAESGEREPMNGLLDDIVVQAYMQLIQKHAETTSMPPSVQEIRMYFRTYLGISLSTSEINRLISLDT